MKVCVVGAGAAGCTIGGTLTEGGSDVWLIDSYKEHVEVMNAIGLRMRDGDVERTVKVNARTGCDGIGVADLVIVLVKSFHTRKAVESAAPIIGKNTLVMSLQNGLGHEDIIADVVGREHVLGGKTYVGGVFLGAGNVRATTRGKETIIGELDGSITERVQAVADEFNRANLLTMVSDNIMAVMWDRLLINVATGALSAITRLTYGGLYRVPDLEICATAAVAEGIAVAAAAGVRLSSDDPRQAWIKAAQGLPPEFKASMLQSVQNNTLTEIDFVNGSVIRLGEVYGVPTPVNQTLVASIKGIELSLTAYPGKV
jgi:2-dehydropantoate 2-reductase